MASRLPESRRYGASVPAMEKAWILLADTLYNMDMRYADDFIIMAIALAVWGWMAMTELSPKQSPVLNS